MIPSKLNHAIRNLSILILAVAATPLPGRSQAKPAQSTTAQEAPQKDSSFIDAQGAAHITRVIPVPATVSRQAQKFLALPLSDAPIDETLAQRRRQTDMWQARTGEEARQLYPVKAISDTEIAGVPVKIITPLVIPPARRARVLINVHGGGFNSDSGSLTETIPIANLTRTKVVAVLYRLAPEYPFPAAVDDTVAVYKQLLKTHRPRNIGIYGTSAGAVLTAEVAVKIKQLGLPLPAALGIFSGMGDFSRVGDSQAMYSINGLSRHLEPPGDDPMLKFYVGSTSLTDPVLSPVFANLHGMPPSLFISSERDLLLSGTTILHRKFLSAGDDARLVVFEALPHAFWNLPSLPESKEADGIMARFFDKELGR